MLIYFTGETREDVRVGEGRKTTVPVEKQVSAIDLSVPCMISDFSGTVHVELEIAAPRRIEVNLARRAVLQHRVKRPL